MAHCWVLEQQATTTKKHRVLVLVWCGCFSSVPYLIQHAAVASFGVVVWLVGVGLLFGYCIVDASIL